MWEINEALYWYFIISVIIASYQFLQISQFIHMRKISRSRDMAFVAKKMIAHHKKNILLSLVWPILIGKVQLFFMKNDK